MKIAGKKSRARVDIIHHQVDIHTLETYSVVAYLYLVMTLLLSMVVKWIERAMARERHRG